MRSHLHSIGFEATLHGARFDVVVQDWHVFYERFVFGILAQDVLHLSGMLIEVLQLRKTCVHLVAPLIGFLTLFT